MNSEMIRQRRKEMRLSQEELGALTSVSQETISALERGAMEPSLSTLRSLSAALNIPIATLLTDPQSAEPTAS